MTKKVIKKAEKESLNLKEEQLKKLKSLFPDIVADGKINWDKLKATLGESIDTSFEKFSFTWAGKSEAIKNVLIPSKATLRPDKKESIKFDESENIFIEGDNLEVLKLLQNSYFEKIKMIYIDPPYNTGNDFVYKDDFRNSIKNYHEQTGQTDSDGNRLQTNAESNGRFHSNWLNMIYPRLKLSWNLLTDDGIIFVSIDDNEAHHLRIAMNEIFGEENFIATFPWRKRTAKSDVPFGVSQDFEWILAYTKGNFWAGQAIERKYYKSNDFKEKWRLADLTKQCTKAERPNSFFTLINPKNGKKYPANPNRVWGITTDTVETYLKKGKIVFPGDYNFLNITIPAFRVFENEDKEKNVKKFGSEEALASISTLLPQEIGRSEDGTQEILDLFNQKVFPFPKPIALIKHLLKITPDKDCIVLDFFAGSGTTAHAILSQNQEDNGNRKFILVQIPEQTEKNSDAYKAGYKSIADITKERIRRTIKITNEKRNEELDFNGTNGKILGFKVFILNESTYPENQFEFDPDKDEAENKKAFKAYLEKASQQDFTNKVNELDLIYENIIKEGLSLNSKIEELKIAKSKVFAASDDKSTLLICLDHKIDKSTVTELKKPEYKGKIFIAFDNALDDSSKANLGLHLSLKTI